MFVDDEACVKYGLDPKHVERLARKISIAAAEARTIGLKVFGASGSGVLRVFSHGKSGDVASLDGSFDGGDGGDDW